MPTSPRAIVEVSLDIAASPPVLWATLADLGKWPRWSQALQSARWVSGPEWTLGAQLELTLNLDFPVRRWSGVATLTEVQPAAAVSWEAEFPLDVITVLSCQLKPSALGTLLVIRQVYYGGWVLLYRLSGFAGRMRKLIEAALHNLKVYLEVGA